MRACLPLLALAVPFGLRAQSPALASTPSTPAGAASAPAARTTAKVPAYHVLRFEERWSADAAAAVPGGHLKHIPVGPGNRAWLTLGGQLRWRGEDVSHFLSTVGGDRTDGHGLARALLSADLWVTPHARAFVEGRDAYGYGRELPGGRRASDHDRWDVQNLFGELRAGGARAGAYVRGGRQEYVLGRDRIVGVADWANVRRGIQGVRAGASLRGVTLDAIDGRPVQVRMGAANAGDSTTTFRAATLGGAAGPVTTWQLYLLELAQDSTRFAGISGAHRRVTSGGRAEGRLPSFTPALALGWELEGAVQRGRLGAQRVDAWFTVAEVSARLARAPWTPTLAFGADAASGDTEADDGTSNTFHQLFPTAHAHGGYADVVGRQNARERRLVLTLAPTRATSLRAAAHAFGRTSAADAVYGKQGTALRAITPSASGSLGREVDVTGQWQVGRHLRLLGGWAHFEPGAWFRETAGGAHAVDWGFLGTTFTF